MIVPTTTSQLFYNLLTRDALLIHDGVAHLMEGPYDSRAQAEQAAEEVIERLELDAKEAETRH